MAGILSEVGAVVKTPVNLVRRAIKSATSAPKNGGTSGISMGPAAQPAGSYDVKRSNALAQAAMKAQPVRTNGAYKGSATPTAPAPSSRGQSSRAF